MKIHVKFFAVLREQTGINELDLDVPVTATVAVIRLRLLEIFPAVEKTLQRAAFAVNRTYAGVETCLSEGDELAIIPPVSGG